VRLIPWLGACLEALVRRLEAMLHFVVAPGNQFYALYMRQLREVRAIGGVGRQTGLYLRHRKPRGSQAYTLLCLMLALLVAVLGFVAQSAVLFGLGSRHGAFFAALLWPPFADILALVFVTLFVCGAAEGTTACLFVVASNWNTAVGLLCRVLAMDRWRSSGMLYVLGEYLIVFAVKIAVCRLVNMMIAYGEAEPALLEPSGDDADHEWVREHVLFQTNPNSPMPSGAEARSMGPASAPGELLLVRAASLEEELEDLNSQSWLPSSFRDQRALLRPLSTSVFPPAATSFADLTQAHGRSRSGRDILSRASEGLGSVESSGSEGWTDGVGP